MKALLILIAIIATPFIFLYATLKHFTYTIWIDFYLAVKYTFIGFFSAFEVALTEGRQITPEEIEKLVADEESKESDFIKNHF